MLFIPCDEYFVTRDTGRRDNASELIKYTRAEFKSIALATGTGMIVMGFVAFFVKLIHIPINQVGRTHTSQSHYSSR